MRHGKFAGGHERTLRGPKEDRLRLTRATRHNLSPGDPISVHLAGTETRDAILRTPHGDEIELTGDVAGDGVLLELRAAP